MQRILLVYTRPIPLCYIPKWLIKYRFMNIAALSSIASTWLEKERDFWSSYLFAFASLWVTVLLLTFWRKDFGRVKTLPFSKGLFFLLTLCAVKLEPQGNILPLAIGAMTCGVKNRFRLRAALPEYQLEHFGRSVPWDKAFVDNIRSCLIACRVMSAFSTLSPPHA